MNTAKNTTTYHALDLFRIIAALLVAAIHTSPLQSFSSGADFFLTRVLARTAVPFFFLVTGQFVLSEYLLFPAKKRIVPRKYLFKILRLYGIAILLYLPIGIYAGHYQNLSVLSLLRILVFDGTFYHLWYFPALILGILLLCFLRRICSLKACTLLAGILYFMGLLGDSYWGVISNLPVVSTIYKQGFSLFCYTRNGIFFAPLFLLMGTWFSAPSACKPVISARSLPSSAVGNFAGFLISLSFMTVEAFTLRHFKVQRHDSMYLFLPFCMFFLYRLLLQIHCKKLPAGLRRISTGIYLLHPAMIIAVRMLAKFSELETLLVENSLLHYLAVCVLSILTSWLLSQIETHVPPAATGTSVHRAWLTLDKSAFQHNVTLLCSLLPENCTLMPVLKADAYGHGAVPIGKELNRMGIHAFCVACAAEGVTLRKAGIKGEILILGYTPPSQFPLLRRYHLSQTVIDYSYAMQMKQYGKTQHVHIGIDTGMHRLGENCEHIDQIAEIFSIENLAIDGIFTHLCTADSDTPKDRDFTYQQAAAFYDMLKKLKKRGICLPKIHLQSSYGILHYPGFTADYARVGIALYGVLSTKQDFEVSFLNLRPVLSLKARIAAVKDLCPGDAVGYGRTFTADRPMRIATLSIGYADGLPRALSNGKGSVLIQGHKCPILGRICMDQTTVDITEVPEAAPGDVAVLIGSSGGETITVYDLAEQAGTITNELLSRLGKRLERPLFFPEN